MGRLWGAIGASPLRPLLWMAATSSFVWALADARFRDPEGYLSGAFILPISLGASLLVVGWAVHTTWLRPVFWLSLALIGQAVALQLIEAGKAVRYQHYLPLDRFLTEAEPILLGFLTLQIVLVATGIRHRWMAIRARVSQQVKTWQLVGIVMIFGLTSAAASRNIVSYATELIVASLVQTVNLGNLLLMVLSIPGDRMQTWRTRMHNLLGPAGAKGTGLDRMALAAAAWVFLLTAMLSWTVYQNHPHLQDETMYLYQARYFAEGVLTVPAPPVPEAFTLYMTPYRESRWYAIFPPGWPALLAVGILSGAPWLINPILNGLNVLLVFSLVGQLYDRRTARMAIILLSASPWFLFMGMNFMAHTFTTSCALVAALGIMWARKNGRVRWAALGGAAVGVVWLIRPLDGVIVGGLTGLWAVGIGGTRLKYSSIIAFGMSAGLVASLMFPYNKAITGSPMSFPLETYYEEYFGPNSNALGFGPDRGLGWSIDPFPGHTPLEAIINATLNFFSLNIELLGWSTGSSLLLAFLLISRRINRPDLLMLATLATVVAVLSLYWFGGGPDFGARYWYLALVPLLVLSARGLLVLIQSMGGGEPKETAVLTVVLTLSIFAIVNFIPWRAADKYHHYLGMRPDIRQLAAENGFGRSLVLIQGRLFPEYQSAWVYNPLTPQANAPIYAWDKDEDVRRELLSAYADRPIWLIRGPSLTGSGYTVAAGPLSALEAASR